MTTRAVESDSRSSQHAGARPPLVAWIGLGSNLGDRDANLQEAVRRLGTVLEAITVGPTVESVAVDREGRPDPRSPGYRNTAVRGIYHGSPRRLLASLMAIETSMGRDPAEKSLYRPRVIDLDILVLESGGNPVWIEDADLVVPHPRLQDRPFCLEPLKALGWAP